MNFHKFNTFEQPEHLKIIVSNTCRADGEVKIKNMIKIMLQFSVKKLQTLYEPTIRKVLFTVTNNENKIKKPPKTKQKKKKKRILSTDKLVP